MVLIDFNQLALTAIMLHLNKPGAVLNLNIGRKLILSMLGVHMRMHKNQGHFVICCDGKTYWRRQVFRQYKLHRVKDREESKHDWNMIHTVLNTMKEELKTIFPHRVVEVDGAEADDVIAILTRHHTINNLGNSLIISSDKDFLQLQKYPLVKQYSPMLRQYISTDNPQIFLKTLIMRGDRVDGIPNFISEDDVFVSEGKRQKRLTTEKIEKYLTEEPTEFCVNEAMSIGWSRNDLLINFDRIPNEVTAAVLQEWQLPRVEPSKKDFMKYLMKADPELVANISDYY